MSTLMKFLGLIFFTLFAFLILAYFSFPHVASLRFINPGVTAVMMERGGPIHRRWVSLAKISPHLRQAVIVAEDGNFYRHHGIDFFELRESLRKNLKKKGFARGFSTITMQLARNLYLSPQKTLTRKLMEILIALKMEEKLSKDRILEVYLNVIEWGRGIYGAESASQFYFKKPASSLSASEAVFLAAILPNPRRWGHWPPGPYVSRRQQVILARMGYQATPKEIPELPELPEGLPEETPPESVPSVPAAPESETRPEEINPEGEAQ